MNSMYKHILSKRKFWVSIDYDGGICISGNQPAQLMCVDGRWYITTTEPREHVSNESQWSTEGLYRFMILAGIIDSSRTEHQRSYTFTDEDIQRYNGWKSL